MATSCDGCFYEAQRSDIDPCKSCGNGDDYDNWVSINFLKNVPDDEASIEGEGVMSQMAEQLLQSKPQQGVKYDEDKLQWSLLPFRALKEVVARTAGA
jgi:hypothetical protein